MIQSPVPAIIIVVNNGSHDRELLKKNLENLPVHLLDPGSNLGYIHAFLFAVDHVLTIRDKLPELVVLSNTDIVIDDTQFFEKCLKILQNRNFACAGPAIWSSLHHINQNPFMKSRVSRAKLKFLNFIQNVYPLYLCYQFAFNTRNHLKRLITNPESDLGHEQVYALHGSFMIFSRAYIEKAASLLHHAPFLFAEEIYVAEIARILDMPMLYEPTLRIIHHEHATTRIYKKPATLRLLHNSTSVLLNDFFTGKN